MGKAKLLKSSFLISHLIQPPHNFQPRTHFQHKLIFCHGRAVALDEDAGFEQA